MHVSWAIPGAQRIEDVAENFLRLRTKGVLHGLPQNTQGLANASATGSARKGSVSPLQHTESPKSRDSQGVSRSAITAMQALCFHESSEGGSEGLQ